MSWCWCYLWILPPRHRLNKDLEKRSPLLPMKASAERMQVHGGGISFCIQYFLIQIKVRVMCSTENCWAFFGIPLTCVLPALTKTVCADVCLLVCRPVPPIKCLFSCSHQDLRKIPCKRQHTITRTWSSAELCLPFETRNTVSRASSPQHTRFFGLMISLGLNKIQFVFRDIWN